ncbi:MAG: hypothetical protein Q9191_003235 [Dirinaria sp. TL-2023a]
MRGTPFLPLVYKILGAHIGSRVHLDTLAITEPDLCEIQNNCSINSSAVLFGHSLDRGQFSQAPLKVGSGSTMDNHSLLLLGSSVGKYTHLKHSSATLMHSVISGSSQYSGVPPQLQQTSASLADGYREWKKRSQKCSDRRDCGASHHRTQISPPSLTSTPTSIGSPSATVPQMKSRTSSQPVITSDSAASRDITEDGTQPAHLQDPDREKLPVFKSQYKGAKPEYRDPQALDQPKSNTNITSLMEVFSAMRDKAQTPLKAIDRAFEEEVKFWQEQFSTKLSELGNATSELKNTLLDLGRQTASTEDLELLVNDVRNMPDSGDTSIAKAQDASLTDWAEHRQQLSVRVEKMKTPKPYEDHSVYADTIRQDYGIVALDLLCQGELDWMIWQNFAWTILAFQDPPTIALLASSRRLFNRSVNRITAVDALILPTMVWGRLSKRGQLGDSRMNTIHGRYAHTASGIKCLWMSILDSYETYRSRMALPPWSDLEYNSFYWVIRDHCVAMNVPSTDLAPHWQEELHKHRSRIASMKWRKWPVATAIVGNTLEDYLSRFPADARRPLRQLLAVACPEEMLDGMGYRPIYPSENEFRELRDAIQGFYHEEAARQRYPHSLSSHMEIGGWKSRAEQIGPSERGPSMPHVLTDSATATAMKEAGQTVSVGSCPFGGNDTSVTHSPSPASPNLESAVARLMKVHHNFGHNIGQRAAMTVEDVKIPEDLIEVTEEEVALHCSPEHGYWSIVGAYVYDTTLSIMDDVHPGGKAILQKYGGKRATAAFRAHSEDARIVACNFIVAKLKGSQGDLRND